MSTQTATLRTKSYYDCLLHVPGSPRWKQFLRSQQDVSVLEMSWSTSRGTFSAYFSVSPKLLYNNTNMDQVEIDPLFAAAIDVHDNQQVCIQMMNQKVVPCKAVSVVPTSADELRVCEQNKEFITNHLQDQIRVVQPSFCFTLFKGQSALCPKLKVVRMEPDSVPCTLLVRDTAVEILQSVPLPTFGRSLTAPAASDNNSGSGGLSHLWGSISSLGQSFIGGIGKQESRYNNKPVDKSGDSGIYSGADSEVSTPSSLNRTPDTSPVALENEASYMHSLMSWFAPPVKNCIVDSAVDPLPLKGKGSISEAPNGLTRHKKQASSPFPFSFDKRLLPEYLNTPSMNVILRVQPYTSATVSLLDNVRQLDVYVHPWTFPALLYLKRKSAKDIPSYLVKLQAVFPLEKPNKKPTKTEQGEEETSQQPQSFPVQKGIVKALVVRLCFTALYYPGSNVLNQRSHVDPVNVKPGHIVISDCVRQQLGIRDFARVRLTEVVEHMRIPCNGHSIQLTLLNKKEVLSKEALHESFQTWLKHVGQYSLFGAPLVYHMILSLPTQQEKFCDVEVKLTPGSSTRRLKEASPSDDAAIKNIDCVLLEDRDLTSSRVSLTVVTEPVKANPKSTASDKGNELLVMPELSQIKEPFLLEPHNQLGGVDEYVTAGLKWINVALEKQLTMDRAGHGVNAGSLLICAKSNSRNAGCGITSVAKEICRRATNYPLLAHIIVMECASHRGRASPFKDALSRKMAEARWFQPSIILLDDLDHIAPHVEHTSHDHGDGFNSDRMSEILQDLLIEEMKYGSSVVVMATAQSTTSLNTALLPSRGSHVFRKIIEISPPTLAVRQEILQTVVSNKHLHHGITNLEWKKVSSRMEGYLVKDIVNIVERAIHSQECRSRSHDNTLISRSVRGRSFSVDTLTPRPKELTCEDFMKAVEGYKPLALRSVPLHKPEDITFANVGGLDHIKATLVEAVQWPSKYPRLFSSFKLKQTSGILLYGAPGTGKTMIAKALGKEFGLNFISIKGPELLNKYIGASEQAVRDVFIRAHSAKPCILFFDEFDALAPQRGHDNTGVTDRVVNQLLTQLDGIDALEGVYVLAASSRPDLIDPALLRPGRIDKSLYCDLPNQDEQIEILEALSKSLPLGKDVDFREVTNDCQYFTGADLKALLYNAQLLVAHNILNGEKKPEGMKKQGALNGMAVGKIWCSANVSKEKRDEVAQRIRAIQRINSHNNNKSKSKDKQLNSNNKQENLLITQSDLLAAVKGLQPSISQKDRERYLQLYDGFVNKADVGNIKQQRSTLA